MINNSQNDLVGYWVIDSAPENTSEAYGEIYLRFTEDGLLQWGYENQWRICVLSFDYWTDDKNIITVCPPNPRTEYTPYSFTNDEKLKIRYSNYETVWKRTDKQDFFESNEIWDSGTLGFRQLDYMSELDSEPTEFQIKRANRFKVSPQTMVNTTALWHSWEYSRGQFASFHADEFKQILECGVFVGEKCNEDKTLLMYIVSDGHIEVINAMLENDFEINAQDMYGHTPLDYAVFSKNSDMFELLRKRGALMGKELKHQDQQ